MWKIWLLVLLHFCNGEQVRSDEDLLLEAYGLSDSAWQVPYYHDYQPTSRIAGFGGYEGRSPIRTPVNPFLKYILKSSGAEDNILPEGRISNLGNQILNAALFNNRFTTNNFRPFGGFGSKLPVSLNPNYNSPLSTFETCTSPNAESGICAPGSICSLFGGRPSGSCLLGGVCCVNAVTSCGGTVTLNNTYWQSPTTPVASPSNCALTVKLNSQLLEQKKDICQVRVDFISFAIAQPNTDGVCNVDTFQVGGGSNRAPIICGENTGQHMYLQVPNSGRVATDLQLVFSFGRSQATVTRNWNLKISMLPCGADYLAPADCLQYFSAAAGTFSSFNWKDVPVAAGTVRQLASQEYNICFRPEQVTNQQANRICYSVCTVTNPNSGFKLSDIATTLTSQTIAAFYCPNDFISIAGGFDQALPLVSNDRYCGGAFNPNSASANAVVCSTGKPFRLFYRTNGDEAAVAASAPFPGTPLESGNLGFCLSFTQS